MLDALWQICLISGASMPNRRMRNEPLRNESPSLMRVTFTVPLMSKGLSAAMLVWLTDNPIAQAIIKYA
jgi:hypothetical protein